MTAPTDLLRECRDGISNLRRSHYSCEDCWYSCPKSSEGCCNEAEGSDCNCGADQHNTAIDTLLARIDAQLASGGWISVEERLPELHQRVMIICSDADGDPTHTLVHFNGTEVTKRKGRYHLFLGYGGVRIEDATHWQPLPEPPSGAAK